MIKGTLDQVSITDNDSSSIKWFNDKKMPATIGSQCPRVINELIAGFGLTARDPQYVVHTGEAAWLLHKLAETGHGCRVAMSHKGFP